MKPRICLSVVLLVFLLVQPGYLYSTKVAYGTAAGLLQEWKGKTKNLQSDLALYVRKLIRSQEELESYQMRLETLQVELIALQTRLDLSLEDLAEALRSLENLSILLEELKSTLAMEQLQGQKDKILIGVGAGATGIVVGILSTLIFLWSRSR